jgi:hypothetical protein
MADDNRRIDNDVRGVDRGGAAYRTDEQDRTTRTILWVSAAVAAALLLWWLFSAMADTTNAPGVPNTGNVEGTVNDGSGTVSPVPDQQSQ